VPEAPGATTSQSTTTAPETTQETALPG